MGPPGVNWLAGSLDRPTMKHGVRVSNSPGTNQCIDAGGHGEAERRGAREPVLLRRRLFKRKRRCIRSTLHIGWRERYT